MPSVRRSKRFTKDPDAVLDYKWDWVKWLQDAESIISHSMEADPGITIDSSDHTATAVIAWLSGGTVKGRYRVRCRITTDQGRTDDRSVFLEIQER